MTDAIFIVVNVMVFVMGFVCGYIANAAHWLCTSCNGVLDTYHKEAFAHCPFCGAIMSIDYEWLLKKGGL